jgi:DNA-binding transcriptional LysR family regulator
VVVLIVVTRLLMSKLALATDAKSGRRFLSKTCPPRQR